MSRHSKLRRRYGRAGSVQRRFYVQYPAPGRDEADVIWINAPLSVNEGGAKTLAEAHGAGRPRYGQNYRVVEYDAGQYFRVWPLPGKRLVSSTSS